MSLTRDLLLLGVEHKRFEVLKNIKISVSVHGVNNQICEKSASISRQKKAARSAFYCHIFL